jgi:hypothetical protein
MKLFTYWWGIEISAESEEDEALLKQLVDALPSQADEWYEMGGGNVEVGDRPKGEFIQHVGFTVTFNR